MCVTEAVVRRQLRMLRHGGWVELSRMGSVAAERQTAYDAASSTMMLRRMQSDVHRNHKLQPQRLSQSTERSVSFRSVIFQV